MTKIEPTEGIEKKIIFENILAFFLTFSINEVRRKFQENINILSIYRTLTLVYFNYF